VPTPGDSRATSSASAGRPGTTCIIGAGCSGFTTAKRLKDAGLAYDCFELSDDIGGNWYFGNPNGMSSCYQSLHIDTSKWRLAFEDYPVRETITFNTAVTDCERLGDGRWKVTLSTGESREYDHLVVGNGHHWDARTPTYPGSFDGYQVHSHHYRDPFEPYDFRGKRVLVVGAGNSAMDISSELSQRPIAEALFISMRHGVWVLPKYFDGKPADKASLPPWMPARLGRALARAKIKKSIGKMEDYGLPKPDHRPLDAHPSVSGEFLTRVGCGDIIPKGAIDRLDGDGVVFADGSRERFDAIVWATGYNVTFPFFRQPELTPDDNTFPLFKRMVKPGFENLFFLGLAQPLPTLVNFAEQQSKLVVAAIAGRYAFPSAGEMADITAADEKVHLGHFYDSPRHRMQVDFNIYVADLVKEIERGAQRASSPVA
jgi:hypothetical protein